MKLLFLVVLLATGTSLNAQEEIVDKAMLRKRALLFKAAGKDTVKQKQLEAVVAPGRRVRTLPQDGMPCIVPGAADIAAIPNVAAPLIKTVQPAAGRIPNAWKKRKNEESILIR